MKARVLLVEDDEDLARGVVFNLEQDGYSVEHRDTLAGARAHLEEDYPDLLLLDLNLPDGDGLELLKELREEAHKLPVICLTARAQEADLVMGFGLGADDYLKKPFGVAELLARLEAILRRAGTTERKVLNLAGTVVDLDARTVRCGEREDELTPIEVDLLVYLLERKGRAVDRAELLKELWGLHSHHSTRTLDNHVARLRRKIEDNPADPKLLVTVHGVGYRLDPPGTSS